MKPRCSVSAFVLCVLSAPAFGGVPPSTCVQGYLEDLAGTPVQGQVTFELCIFDALTGGTQLWPPPPAPCKDYPDVEVNDGLFAICFGDDDFTPQLFGSNGDGRQPRYLEIHTAGEPMLPRIELHTAPYAFRTGFVDNPELTDTLELGSSTPGNPGHESVFNSSGSVTGVFRGNGGVDDGEFFLSDSAGNQTVTLDSAAGGTGSGGWLYLTSGGTANHDTITLRGNENESGAGGISIMKGETPYTETIRLYGVNGNAHFLGNVGIGTTTPDTVLDLQKGPLNTSAPALHMLRFEHPGFTEYTAGIDNGAFLLESTAGNPGVTAKFGATDGYLGLAIDGGTGNVGIGTTTPQAKLHVAGTPAVDGIMFPDGTLQTTAMAGGSIASWAFASGLGANIPQTTLSFLSPVVTVSAGATQKVLVIANQSFGTTGANNTISNLYIGYRAIGNPSVTAVGSGVGSLPVGSSRQLMGLSAVISGLSAGTYEVGLAGISDNVAGWAIGLGYTTAIVFD